MSRIYCEFDSIDLADLALGRIQRETAQLGDISVDTMDAHREEYRFTIPSEVVPNGYNATSSSIPPLPVMLDNSATFSHSLGTDKPERYEPAQNHTAYAYLQCSESDAGAVISRLHNLGAHNVKSLH